MVLLLGLVSGQAALTVDFVFNLCVSNAVSRDDNFFKKPADLRSLPQHIREQISQSAPLRQGEVHAAVTLHNTHFKGTTMPTARVWVEPYYAAKGTQRPQEGIQFSIYDPSGTRLLAVARIREKHAMTVFEAAARAYLRQSGSPAELKQTIDRVLSGHSDTGPRSL